MGAYKIGEIASICDLVQPQIGVITGISSQHLSLFGTMKNLLKAKYELIEALPQDGLAIFNGDNSYCLSFYKKTKIKKWLYSIKKSAEIRAEKIKTSQKGLEFTISAKGVEEKFQTPLLGKHNISNILAATAVAFHLGMTLEEIAKGVVKLKPVGQTMVVLSGPKGSTLIDDTYNANPDGVLVALDYLKTYKGKKILVFQPMIELGEAASEAHQRVGREAVKVCHQIFLTNRNYYSSLVEKLSLKQRGKIGVEENPQALKQRLQQQLKKEDVILFEGKEAEKYLKAFKVNV